MKGKKKKKSLLPYYIIMFVAVSALTYKVITDFAHHNTVSAVVTTVILVLTAAGLTVLTVILSGTGKDKRSSKDNAGTLLCGLELSSAGELPRFFAAFFALDVVDGGNIEVAYSYLKNAESLKKELIKEFVGSAADFDRLKGIMKDVETGGLKEFGGWVRREFPGGEVSGLMDVLTELGERKGLTPSDCARLVEQLVRHGKIMSEKSGKEDDMTLSFGYAIKKYRDLESHDRNSMDNYFKEAGQPRLLEKYRRDRFPARSMRGSVNIHPLDLENPRDGQQLLEFEFTGPKGVFAFLKNGLESRTGRKVIRLDEIAE